MRYPKSENYWGKEDEPRVRTINEKRTDGNHLEKEDIKVT